MYKHPDHITDVNIEGYDVFSVQEIKDNEVSVSKIDDEGNFLISISGNQFKARLLHTDREKRKYTIRIDGYNFTCKVKTHLHHLISQLGFNKINKSLSKSILAPMPGLILDVAVVVGDEVDKGQTLFTLEAMKMENIIKSSQQGKIKSILYQRGEKVDKNDVVVEME